MYQEMLGDPSLYHPMGVPIDPGGYMGPEMNCDYTQIGCVITDGVGDNHYAVSALTFDKEEELLWSGNQGGHVTSYYGPQMQKYTSFQAHGNLPIRQLQTFDQHIIILTGDSVLCRTKQGITAFTYQPPQLHDMHCMLLTSPTTLLIGGRSTAMVELDIAEQKEIRTVDVTESGSSIIRSSNTFYCVADMNKKLHIRDPKTLRSIHHFEPHLGAIMDFDVLGNQLITCGYSNRHGGRMVTDRFLMVYDLRMMRSTAPLQVGIEPIALRFVPTFTDRICAVSQIGQFQVFEQVAMATSSFIHQVMLEQGVISCFERSATSQALAFGDSSGLLHLFSAGGTPPAFNHYSIDTQFAHVEPNRTRVPFDDYLYPLASIPTFYPMAGEHGPQRMLSEWPEQMTRPTYRVPQPISQDIMRSVRMVHNIGYAPNLTGRDYNQVPYAQSDTKGRTEAQGAVPESPLGRGEDPFLNIPSKYRRVETKYSKLGTEDFDYRHYNKTPLVGLEPNIPNAYCNAMLQMLYFIDPTRVAFLNHLCEKEFCLSCELGFLFHMFDIQKGNVCEAGNFLRAFRTIPEASALGLVLGDAEESLGKANVLVLIQGWIRFILQQLHTELHDTGKNRHLKALHPPAAKEMEQKLLEGHGLDSLSLTDKSADDAQPESEHSLAASGGSKVETVVSRLFNSHVVRQFRCRCGLQNEREDPSTVFDLVYPKERTDQVTFHDVVRNTLQPEQKQTQAWCSTCQKYQPHSQSIKLKSLPDILVLNSGLQNEAELNFWKLQEDLLRKNATVPNKPIQMPIGSRPCRYGAGCTRKDCHFWHEDRITKDTLLDSAEVAWLPESLNMGLTPEGDLTVSENPIYVKREGEDGRPSYNERIAPYELFGTICQVKETKGSCHLVCIVDVGETYHQRKEKVTCSQWYLLNDFAITPVEAFEARQFDLNWKVPAVFLYARKYMNKNYDLAVVNPINTSCLFQNSSLVTSRRRSVAFTPLQEGELPVKGELVGLDAEFVTLNQEEAEFRSDGTRSTIKPSQMCVARITCVRSRGNLAGVAFIDDYISTQEQVVDYVTQFSGIEPGDLDASLSSKHLTTLKSSYLKLRALVGEGAVFVGHGLKKDFQVINLVVPKEQVFDTVELFQLPRQRKISLKFLAWYFLGSNIQSGAHDSIVDACTALRLYEIYKQLKTNGELMNQTMQQLYDAGRRLQWKVPEDGSPSGFSLPTNSK